MTGPTGSEHKIRLWLTAAAAAVVAVFLLGSGPWPLALGGWGLVVTVPFLAVVSAVVGLGLLFGLYAVKERRHLFMWLFWLLLLLFALVVSRRIVLFVLPGFLLSRPIHDLVAPMSMVVRDWAVALLAVLVLAVGIVERRWKSSGHLVLGFPGRDHRLWLSLLGVILLGLFVVGLRVRDPAYLQWAVGRWKVEPQTPLLPLVPMVPAWAVVSLFSGLGLLFVLFAIKEPSRVFGWLFAMLLLLFGLRLTGALVVDTATIAGEPVSLFKYINWPTTLYVRWWAFVLLLAAVIAVADRVWERGVGHRGKE